MTEKLIKSKERVQKHGEVFTPSWMVQKMLDLVDDEAHDVTKTFLEPAAGDGNFLVAILERKLDGVLVKFDKRYWTTKSLLALSSIYGIEFLEDNLEMARFRMLEVYLNWFEQNIEKLTPKSKIYKSAKFIIHKNIVRGNTLTKKHPETDEPIIFSEWKPVGRSKVEKIDFRFDEETTIEPGIPEGQMSLFEFDEPQEILSNVIEIQKVYLLGEGK